MNRKFITYFFLILFLAGMTKPAHAFIFRRKTDSIKIIFDRNQLVLPGESFNIGVVSWHKKGKVKKTIRMKGGFVFWWRYKVEVTGGTFWNGKVTVNKQLMPAKGKYISIKVYPRKRPEQAQKILIPLNYEVKLEFLTTNEFDKAPGCKFKGALISTFNNGMRQVYRHLNRSSVSETFLFSAIGGTWENAEFTIEPDFLKINNHRAALIAQSLRNQEVADTFEIVLDYKHNYELYFSGSDGSSGFSGNNGSNGLTGERGEDGQPGQNGEPGSRGPDVGVWGDMYYDSLLHHYLIYVYVENYRTGNDYRYLINPDGGGLQVTSVGGDGGRGGHGGNGGDGGDGWNGRIWYEQKVVKKMVQQQRTRMVTKTIRKQVKDTMGNIREVEEKMQVPETYYTDVVVEEVISIPRQERGEDGKRGGHGGDGGFGGDGGDGGNIYFNFTDDCWIFENLFTANSFGGSGGMHGSVGKGGTGGTGGSGEPNGRNACNGMDGGSASGWAYDGSQGRIYKNTTEEFFFYGPSEEAVSVKQE